jgi:transcriptional regulator with XRE-family HTH domain
MKNKKPSTPGERISFLIKEMKLTHEDVVSLTKISISLLQKVISNVAPASPKFISKFNEVFNIEPKIWIEKGGPSPIFTIPNKIDPWKSEAYKLQEQIINNQKAEIERLINIIENLSKK